MKKQLFIIPLLSMIFSLSGCVAVNPYLSSQNGQTDSEGLYVYDNYKQGEVIITKFKGENKGFVILPDTIDGKKVTAIKKDAFTAREDYHHYTCAYYIPDSINVVEQGSFLMGSVFVSEGSIKTGWYDEAMRGDATDNNNTGSVYANVNINNTLVHNEALYVSVGDTLYYAKCLSQKNAITVPSIVNSYSVSTIGSYAFAFNDYIKTVILPSSVTYLMKNGGFTNCLSLEKIDWKLTGVSRLYAGAVVNCPELKQLYLPENAVTIYDNAFQSCGTINNVYISANLTRLYQSAFIDTTVNHITYGGTQSQWTWLLIQSSSTASLSVYSGLENATVEFLGSEQVYTLEHEELPEFGDIPSGSSVTITGIVFGYARYTGRSGTSTDMTYYYNYIEVGDLNSAYVITCYDSNSQGRWEYNESLIGKEVRVTGTKMLYNNSFELREAVLTQTGNPTTYSIPKKTIDWFNPNLDLEASMYYWTELTGTIATLTSNKITLEETSKFYIYGRNSVKAGEPTFAVGDTITVVGVLVKYVSDYEIIFSLDNMWNAN